MSHPVHNVNLSSEAYFHSFDANSVLPIQFFTPQEKGQGKSLVFAVFEDFVASLLKDAAYSSLKPRWRQRLEEDLAYLIDEDDSYLYSFISVCHILDLDSDYWRKGLLSLAEDAKLHPPAKGHMRRHKERSYGRERVSTTPRRRAFG